MIGSLQSRTAFSQNVHLKHRLWLHLHSEGGDGTLIDAFSHVVIQAFNQLPNITAEVLQALSVFRLQGREMDNHIRKEQKVGTNVRKDCTSAQNLSKSTRLHSFPPCVCKP